MVEHAQGAQGEGTRRSKAAFSTPTLLLHGYLPALEDPTLPLELLADPGAGWWEIGARHCVEKIIPTLALGLLWRRVPLIRAVRRWAQARIPTPDRRSVRFVRHNLRALRRCSPADLHDHLKGIVYEVTRHGDLDHGARLRALLSLAQHLRAGRPRGCERELAALDTLDRYAP